MFCGESVFAFISCESEKEKERKSEVLSSCVNNNFHFLFFSFIIPLLSLYDDGYVLFLSTSLTNVIIYRFVDIVSIRS